MSPWESTEKPSAKQNQAAKLIPKDSLKLIEQPSKYKLTIDDTKYVCNYGKRRCSFHS